MGGGIVDRDLVESKVNGFGHISADTGRGTLWLPDVLDDNVLVCLSLPFVTPVISPERLFSLLVSIMGLSFDLVIVMADCLPLLMILPPMLTVIAVTVLFSPLFSSVSLSLPLVMPFIIPERLFSLLVSIMGLSSDLVIVMADCLPMLLLTAIAVTVLFSHVGNLTAGKRLDIVIAGEFFSGNWHKGVRSCSGAAKTAG